MKIKVSHFKGLVLDVNRKQGNLIKRTGNSYYFDTKDIKVSAIVPEKLEVFAFTFAIFPT